VIPLVNCTIFSWTPRHDKVCDYLGTLDVGSVPLDLATIKLVRLRDGLVQYRM